MGMQNIMQGAGYGGFTALTPEEQFYQYGLGAFRPGANRVREAFYQAQNPLLTQYALAEPRLGVGTENFADWMDLMGDRGTGALAYNPYGTTYGADPQTLRGRAEQASFLAGLTGTAESALAERLRTNLLAGVDPETYTVTELGDPDFSQEEWERYYQIGGPERALYRQTFGTGEDAAQQQANLVQLLALQRAGGDPYGAGSRMGQAITRQLGGIRSYLEATDPETNFLDWYIDRTTGGTGWLG